MSQRKTIVFVTSVIEAETVRSILSSADIPSEIDNGTAAGILPHLTQSMGGVAVSVWEKDFEFAQQLLSTIPEADENELISSSGDATSGTAPVDGNQGQVFRAHYIKALGAAIFGWSTGFMAIYSFYHFRKAYEVAPTLFKTRYPSFFVSCALNLMSLAVAPVIYKALLHGWFGWFSTY